MIPEIAAKRPEINELCNRNRVQYLALVGSATGPLFDPERSDVDFLVEFQDMPPAVYADAYFNLKEELERLLARPVDLITRSTVINPYLLRDLDLRQEALYAA